MQNNRAGIFNSQVFSFSLGYDLKIQNSWHMSAALLGSLNQKSINFDMARFDEQYVNQAPLFIKKNNFSDVGFGLMWYYNPARSDSSARSCRRNQGSKRRTRTSTLRQGA